MGFSHCISATIKVVGEGSETLAPRVCPQGSQTHFWEEPGSVGAALAMACPRVGQGGSGG